MPTGARMNSTEVRRRLQTTRVNMPNAVATALYQETEIEATEAKRRCPVDTGALRGTIHVEGPFFTGMLGRVIYTFIACGGPSAPYALYVHEDLTAFHKVGEAKFIESVILESRPYLAQRVMDRIDMNRVVGA